MLMAKFWGPSIDCTMVYCQKKWTQDRCSNPVFTVYMLLHHILFSQVFVLLLFCCLFVFKTFFYTHTHTHMHLVTFFLLLYLCFYNYTQHTSFDSFFGHL